MTTETERRAWIDEVLTRNPGLTKPIYGPPAPIHAPGRGPYARCGVDVRDDSYGPIFTAADAQNATCDDCRSSEASGGE